jgi:uncharacterized protein
MRIVSTGIAILMFAVLFIAACNFGATDGATAAGGDAQVVRLSFENYDYKLTPSTVQAGRLVQLVADTNLPGCAAAVTVPSFNIQKNVRPGDNVIEFTPTKAGPLKIMCAMGMYNAVLDVK